MPDIEPAAQLLSLDNSKLIALHGTLHKSFDDNASVELHHLVTTELGRRGFDHGHENDEWSAIEIEVDKARNVDLVEMSGSLPLQDRDMFVKELGMTRGDVTVVLTVNGYEMRVDGPSAEQLPVIEKAYDPESALNDRQKALYDAIESVAARFGDFDCGTGPDGAHYMPASENVFASEGIKCANCIFFDGGGGCEIMDRQVEADAACKFWIIPENLLGQAEEPLMPLVSADGLMKHGNHDQSTHGHGGSDSGVTSEPLSPAIRKQVDSILPRRVQRELYGTSYESGDELRRDNPTLASARAATWKQRRNESIGLIGSASNDEDKGFHADRIITAQGFLDGAAGVKAVYTRPMMGLSDFLSIDKAAVIKHGSHDQSSHGRRGGGSLSSAGTAADISARVLKGENVVVAPDVAYQCLQHMADADGVPDLANLDVAGTNLYDKGNKGLERAEMPQIPDVSKERFLSDMDGLGIKVSRERVSPTTLKPIQKEISGKKAGGIMRNMEKNDAIPDTDKERIFITNDGFVLDGHHRWAAAATLDAAQGNFDMPVFKIDLPYDKALTAIKDWNQSVGIKALAMGEDNPTTVFKAVVVKHGTHDQSSHGNRGGLPSVIKEPMPKDTAPDVREAVTKVMARAAEFEPQLTAELMADAASMGGEMEGLKFRIKSEKSLAGKVEREKLLHASTQDCADSMSDVVRWTMSFPEESYSTSADTVIKNLEARGYKVRTKNFWDRGDPYQGLNLAVTHTNGMVFEVQVHTKTSWKTKDDQHKKYEVFREAKTNKERWDMWSSMARQSRRVPVPVGATEIGGAAAKKIQPFTVKHADGSETVVPESLNFYKGATGVSNVVQSNRGDRR